MKHEYLFVYEFKFGLIPNEEIMNCNVNIKAKNIEEAINTFYFFNKSGKYVNYTILNIIKIK